MQSGWQRDKSQTPLGSQAHNEFGHQIPETDDSSISTLPLQNPTGEVLTQNPTDEQQNPGAHLVPATFTYMLEVKKVIMQTR